MNKYCVEKLFLDRSGVLGKAESVEISSRPPLKLTIALNQNVLISYVNVFIFLSAELSFALHCLLIGRFIRHRNKSVK